ncbi:NfeD family protein [Clostridium sp. SYSU_GA19001]|uniref:NfeD family protein n=1 Tax=Clostridium caldaquaticum TaxID=2940653 RepID=UPI0020777CD5|nr:NfeD family protein [Clostridium caldaquaticum]MCM8711135.1 NfeD family protein [Clostridium caldaquaticum]
MGSLMLWIIISVLALVIDIATSAFLFLWFTVGGIAAIIALIFNASIGVQIITFIAVSAISMAVGYPMMKNTLKGTVKKTATMEESYVGRELTVDEDLVEKAMVKLDGIYWTIKNIGDPVKKGDRIIITGIEGNKLTVKKYVKELKIEGENK